jgi:regulator of nucleoside diphosphate kinase
MNIAAAVLPDSAAGHPGNPPVMLAESEADALTSLALAALARGSLGAGLLLGEVERASVVAAHELPEDVVTMHAHVVFADEATGAQHRVQLVYPKQADMARGKVSVLTPIGAGLIGIRCGGTIAWPNRSGQYRSLRIVEVIQPQRGVIAEA